MWTNDNTVITPDRLKFLLFLIEFSKHYPHQSVTNVVAARCRFAQSYKHLRPSRAAHDDFVVFRIDLDHVRRQFAILYRCRTPHPCDAATTKSGDAKIPTIPRIQFVKMMRGYIDPRFICMEIETKF
jgi:hypothetical protein